MKKFIILGVLALFVFATTPAMAWFDYTDDSVTNQGGQGGSATVEEGAVDVDIDNRNSNRNTNLNSNINSNRNEQQQGQLQGQAQGQIQGQGQGQDQGQNQGQMNNWTQIYEDKRDHLQGPAIVTPDAKFRRGRAFSGKVRGSEEFFSNVKGLTFKQAVKLSSKSSDITCEPALFSENEFSTDRIKIETSETIPGELMGFLYMSSDGKDVNSVSMIGEAAEEAMKAGATHMRLIDFSAGENAEGSSWNIGLGGGASLMSGTGGDAIAIAPNGGTGYGKAKATSELRPEMVFELRFDASYAAKYQLSQAEYGWSAKLIEDNQVH